MVGGLPGSRRPGDGCRRSSSGAVHSFSRHAAYSLLSGSLALVKRKAPSPISDICKCQHAYLKYPNRVHELSAYFYSQR